LKRKPHRIIYAANLNQILRWQVSTATSQIIEVLVQEHSLADRYSNGSFVIDVESQGEIVQIKQEKIAEEVSHEDK
jgi:topoisomerase-4 subunit A